MKIRTITSLRQFDSLSALWREVTEAGGQNSVLLTHDWFACCWRTAGPNRARELWLVEDSAGPLALIPLVGTKMKYRGLPARVLQLMHPPDAPIVDFPVSRDRDAVMAAVVERLHTRDDWDLFLLPGLSTSSPTWKAFRSATDARLSWRIADRVHVPTVTLTDTRRAALDPDLAAAVRRPRLLDSVVVEQHRTLDPRGPLFEEIMGISRDCPRGTMKVPVTTADEARRFFRELTGRASANGWLSVWVLRYQERIVETEYQLVGDGCVHALRRDGDQSPPELRLADVLAASIMETLLAKPAAHTYYRMPVRAYNGAVPQAGSRESVFVEVFAPRSYAQFLHRVETRVVPLARRLGWNREQPCA